jgi:ATP-dependent DNA ligase
MLSRAADELPVGPGWCYEPKWDGFRAIARAGGGEVQLDSRTDRPLGRYFPELLELLDGLEQPFVLDGEIVIVLPPDSGYGTAAAMGTPQPAPALDFEALQLRLHPADTRVRMLAGEIPATFVAFDAIEIGDRDLRGEPFTARREALRALLSTVGAGTPPAGPEDLRPGLGLVLTPQTDDIEVATRWFEDEEGFGQDGIVAKRDDQRYLENERVMIKVKHHRTADCVVGGYRLDKAGDGVASLLLGLYDEDGTLHYVGHTSAFPAKQRRAMVEELRPLEGGTSFGEGRSPGGVSRWTRGKERPWVSLDPTLVCEVRFDRMQGARFRHAVSLVRWRPDRDPTSCTFDQVAVVGAAPGSSEA